AYNFVHSGVYSWNLGEPATFGSTSQLYQLVLTPLVALFGGREVLAAVWAPRIAGFLAVSVLASLVARTYGAAATAPIADDSRRAARITLLFAAGVLLLNPKFYQHWDTGMETTLSVLVVACLLAAVLRHFDKTRFVLFGLPLLCVLLFWQRPDLPIIGCMPAGL